MRAHFRTQVQALLTRVRARARLRTPLRQREVSLVDLGAFHGHEAAASMM